MMYVTLFGRIKASQLCICFLMFWNIVFQCGINHRNLAEFVTPTPTLRTSTTALLSSTNTRNSNESLVQHDDSIYKQNQNNWDGAPVVIEKYKLLFFTTPKVGCTVWKQLFRRMMNVSNYMEEDHYGTVQPHNPKVNGLKYLYHYDPTTASAMMSDPTWTRAIFVRDPKERFLSAYLDKVIKNENFAIGKCCPNDRTCIGPAKESVGNFIQLMRVCHDEHWNPQSKRILEGKYWPLINFVGHMETLYDDAKKLLLQIGAWEEYGKSGWGPTGMDAIFQSVAGGTGRSHATDAVSKIKTYITPEIEKELEQYYADDYNNEVLNLKLLRLYPDKKN
jgi:Sulfotransferase family